MLKRFTIYFALILCLSGFALAQDKIDPLPANSTLDQSQEWLINALNKNVGYSLVDDTVKIGSLKIEGCKVSYRIFQNYMDSKETIGDRPSLGNTGAKVGQDLKYEVYEDVSFDLKEMDPRGVGLGALPKPKGMQGVSLATSGGKKLIHYDKKGSQVKYNEKGERAMTMLPIKERAGEAIARGFMYTIQLCQVTK